MHHNFPRVPEYQNKKREGIRATIWSLELWCSQTRINSRRKPSIKLSGIFRIQELVKGTVQMTSHFNVINKCVQKLSNEGDVDYYKQTDSVKNPTRKMRKEELLRMKSIVVV